jgi:YVTN family beta-propeller protein
MSLLLSLFVIYTPYQVTAEGLPEQYIGNNTTAESSKEKKTDPPWLGASLHSGDFTFGLAKAVGLKEPKGVLVISVSPGSPAEKSGIQGGSKILTIDGQEVRVGGDIILAIDGKEITRNNDLITEVVDKSAGDKLKLTIYRSGQIKEIDVTLSSRPNFLTVDNKAGLNFTYPSEWYLIKPPEQGETFNIYSPYENSSDPFREYIQIRAFPADEDLEKRVSGIINIRKQEYRFKDFQILSSEMITLRGDPAYKVVYTYWDRQNNITLKAMEIHWVKASGLEFRIVYDAELSKYPEYLSTLEKVIESLKANEAQDMNKIYQYGLRLKGFPVDLALNPVTNKLYIAIKQPDKVYVIDAYANVPVANITLEAYPNSIAINSITNMIYVASDETDKIYVIDGSTNKVIDRVSVGLDVRAVAVDPNEFGSGIVYAANYGNDTISVIDASTNKIVSNIAAGNRPEQIDIDFITNKIYVSNDEIDTVSIIDYVAYDNHTLKLRNTDNVTLGSDTDSIAANYHTGKVYVSNHLGDTISVIDSLTNQMLERIKVRLFPESLALNSKTSKLYVANAGLNIVSVVDINRSGQNPYITDVMVDSYPSSIAINPETNTVYVANYDSKTLSVINGSSNEMIVGVSFDINPPNAGYIECNDNKVSDNEHITYPIGTELKCKSISNDGFRFTSWSSNLLSDNTVSGGISESGASNIGYDSLRNVEDIYSDSNMVTKLDVSKFGTLIANFVKPQTQIELFIPNEYWFALYGVVLSFIIPAMVAWINTLRQRRHLRKFMMNIERVRESDSHNRTEYLKNLATLKQDLQEIFTKGKINDTQYRILNDKISEYENKSINYS